MLRQCSTPPPPPILYQLPSFKGGSPGAKGHSPVARTCHSGLLPLPPKASVFVLESDKLPNGGWEGWGVDPGLLFHSWPIIAFSSVPSVGTTCRHFPGWWLQGPWAVSSDNSEKGHRHGACSQHLPTYSTHCTAVPWSPAHSASVRETSTPLQRWKLRLAGGAGADPASHPQPPWAPGPHQGRL